MQPSSTQQSGNDVRWHMASSESGRQIIVAISGLDTRKQSKRMAEDVLCAARLHKLAGTHVPNSKVNLLGVCGRWDVCMMCGRLLARCRSLVVRPPAFHFWFVCTLFVACRSNSSARNLTGEAVFAVRAASVLVDGVSGYVVVCNCLLVFVVVIAVGLCYCCFCCCCFWLLSLCLWLVSLAMADNAL